MSSESLQSLSVAAVFVGLFFATLGGFGAFHFGQRPDEGQERDRLRAIQALSDRVALLELEQHALGNWATAVEEKLAAPGPRETPASATATPAPAPSHILDHPPIPEGPANVATNESSETPRPAKGQVGKTLTLGAQQRTALIKRLSAHPHHLLTIHAVDGDPQALELASALETAFREARWKVDGVEIVARHSPTPGLSLSTGVFPPREEFIAVYSALERAGFLLTSELDPKLSGHAVVLFVGPRH